MARQPFETFDFFPSILTMVTSFLELHDYPTLMMYLQIGSIEYCISLRRQLLVIDEWCNLNRMIVYQKDVR